jgi:hypothetical protein
MTIAPLPDPLVPADVDLRGFSGFILDVDRLLASELLALATPQELAAAFILWCRAWKQSPPASLPDDERLLAIFSGAGKNWPKVQDMALRGFIKCNDGRLYHKVLAVQANEAWEKRKKFRKRSAKANEKRWTGQGVQQGDLHGEEADAPRNATSILQGDLQGGLQGSLKGSKGLRREVEGEEEKERKKDAASAAADAAPNFENGHDPPTPETELFVRGKAVLGNNAGGLIAKLIKAKGGKLQLARAVIETADTKQNPREYIGRVIAGNERSSLDYDPAL